MNIEITSSNACRNTGILSIEIIFLQKYLGKLVNFLKGKKMWGLVSLQNFHIHALPCNIVYISLTKRPLLKGDYVCSPWSHQTNSIIRVFNKGWESGKLTAARRNLPAWVDHLEQNFSFTEVHHKTFCHPVKTSCPPTKNVIDTLVITRFKKKQNSILPF